MFRTKWFKIGLAVTLLAIVISVVIRQYKLNRAPPATVGSKSPENEPNPRLPAYILPPVALPGRFPEADLTSGEFNPNKTVDYNPDNRIKPGHWATVMTTMVSTEADAQARLLARMTKATGETLPVIGTERWLNSIRPVSLPKGQWKQVETTTYVSPRTDIRNASSAATFRFDLMFGSSNYSVESVVQPTIVLQPFQYVITVFDLRSSRFGFIDQLDCVQGFDPLFWRKLSPDPLSEGFFHWTGSQPDDPAPWPRSALTATSVAHAIWSDFDPNALDQAQRDALIDWLHWGGSLIISGPVGLERLTGSFLEPYLPAKIERRAMLTPEELARFFKPWSMIVPELVPLPGCYLEPQGGGQLFDDTKLMCERAIGRGRIVAVGFPLDTESFFRWPCYSNFFNAVVLRKPGRDVVDRDFGNGRIIPQPSHNLRAQSRLRFLSRDDVASQESLGNAAWNDRSAVPSAAAQILRQKSSFKPPSSQFALVVLGAYLVLLIPLNWLVFRWVGRLEWAWVAAPVISVIGAIAVTTLAALDVGFARALDTIAVLELQGGYERGHLAEYSALYSSLSTNFHFEYEQNNALFLPMQSNPEDPSPQVAPIPATRSLLPVNCSRGLNTQIDDFLVRSNTTGYIRAERMVAVGGPIALDADPTSQKLWIDNQSQLVLRDALVVRAVRTGFEVARIEQLEPKTRSAALRFSPLDFGSDIRLGAVRLLSTPNRHAGENDLAELLAAAMAPHDLSAGEYRLIARCDADISPMLCQPAPTRGNKTTIVSVRLRSVLPPIQSDSNRLWAYYDPTYAESFLEYDETDQ